MLRLKSFSDWCINESVDVSDEIDKIVDTVVEYIDDGEKISFYSPSGNMTYQDYLSKNDLYRKFKPVLQTGNKIVSKFSIVWGPKNKTYNELAGVLDNMISSIGRLKDDNWLLRDLKIKTISTFAKEVVIDYVEFVFEKDYEILSEEFPLPDEKKLRDAFVDITGLYAREIEIGDYETDIYYASNEYDGRMPSESWLDEKLEEICDLFGFSGFSSDIDSAHVSFEY